MVFEVICLSFSFSVGQMNPPDSIELPTGGRRVADSSDPCRNVDSYRDSVTGLERFLKPLKLCAQMDVHAFFWRKDVKFSTDFQWDLRPFFLFSTHFSE